MELITNGNKLKQQLKRCFARYPKSAFAVAWASNVPSLFSNIIKVKKTIQMGVIGTHFYQTEPEVLYDSIGIKNIKFIVQPSGVFHPKIFTFWNDNKWEAFVGSANLTKAAMTVNSEVVLHITNEDNDSDSLKKEMLATITRYWKSSDAKVMNKSTAKIYEKQYDLMKRKRNSLSGSYGAMKTSKTVESFKMITSTWNKFYKEVVQCEEQSYLSERKELLNLALKEFKHHVSFADMEDSTRRMIAGLPNSYYEHSGLFGSMKPAGYYKKAIIGGNEKLYNAIDCIPLDGDVSFEHYSEYIDKFTSALPKGSGLATASRLLTLKRPDTFVCLDSRNREKLCDDFGVTIYTKDYEKYWDTIICRIRDSIWWNEPPPKFPKQLSIWKTRAAMLDVIYYDYDQDINN